MCSKEKPSFSSALNPSAAPSVVKKEKTESPSSSSEHKPKPQVEVKQEPKDSAPESSKSEIRDTLKHM